MAIKQPFMMVMQAFKQAFRVAIRQAFHNGYESVQTGLREESENVRPISFQSLGSNITARDLHVGH